MVVPLRGDLVVRHEEAEILKAGLQGVREPLSLFLNDSRLELHPPFDDEEVLFELLLFTLRPGFIVLI